LLATLKRFAAFRRAAIASLAIVLNSAGEGALEIINLNN
jgi:hypothetical protein